MAHTAAVDSKSRLFPGHRLLPVSPRAVPTLLVVIDTEEEFDWSAPPNPTSRSVTNVLQLPLLQDIFDRHGVTPAYLVDQPVTESPAAVALLQRFLKDGRCEIGAHLHPWLTPPIEETVDPWHAFACNLPPDLERRKLGTLTRSIEQAFDSAPRIFKAGAYGVGPHTAGFLAELGFEVDSSVVPFTDFRPYGGPNFQDWTGTPFRTAEGIVEIPLTAGFAGQFARHGPALFPLLARPPGLRLHLPGIAARLSLLERLRLSPEGHTLQDLVRLTSALLARGERLFMFSLHSSSLLPGATGYVRTEAERKAFLHRIDAYLRHFQTTVGGRFGVVSEFARNLVAAPRG